MQDLETKSLWSQISGKAISGEKEGAQLTLYPSFLTTFGELKNNFPDAKLLAKQEKGSAASHYEDYFKSKEKLGIFGRLNKFEKLDGKDKVYGLRLKSGDVAVSENFLQTNQFAVLSNGQVVITLSPESGTVTAFKANDSFLLSVVNNEIVDGKTGHSWDIITGRAINAETDLAPLPVISSFWFAWISFFPETELVK